MLNFVFYFKDSYYLYSPFYFQEILNLTKDEGCSVFFVENQNRNSNNLFKSYNEVIKFITWDDLLKEHKEDDYYWLISEELKFSFFQASDLLQKLVNNKSDLFFINPILEADLKKYKYENNVIEHDVNFDKLSELIFQSNSSYWIFGGKWLPTLIKQFSTGKYCDFYTESNISIGFSEDNLVRTNLKFYLKHYFDIDQLAYFLKHLPNSRNTSKSNTSIYISFILNLNPKLFFKLLRKKPGLLIKSFLKLDIGLTRRFFYKIVERSISRIYYNIKEKLTFFLSVYYSIKYLFKNRISNSKLSNVKTDSNIISLTTYRDRIKTVYLTLESIWEQSIKPSQVILVLSIDEFATKRELPKSLQRLIKRGLIMKFVEGNVKSYKKLVYTYNDSNVITIDDDIIYPRWWYDKILNAAERNPNSVISFGCKRILFTENFTFLPYRSYIFSDSNESSLINLPIGAYGVFYPKNVLHSDLKDSKMYLKLAPSADDIWFKAMASLNNVQSCQVFNKPPFFCHTLFSQKSALNKHNYYLDMNDIYLWNVFNFYKNRLLDEM